MTEQQEPTVHRREMFFTPMRLITVLSRYYRFPGFNYQHDGLNSNHCVLKEATQQVWDYDSDI